MYDLKNLRIAVIGLGYVGLPLALEFANSKARGNPTYPKPITAILKFFRSYIGGLYNIK